VTALPLETVADHAIQRVTADRSEHRSFRVLVECVCGAGFPDVPSADFSGVLNVALQVFFTHLAALE
jgi:hypothetical protein